MARVSLSSDTSSGVAEPVSSKPEHQMVEDVQPTISSDSIKGNQHINDEHHHHSVVDPTVSESKANPLSGLTDDELDEQVEYFLEKSKLHDKREVFIRGARLARDGDCALLTEDERRIITEETTHKWRQPWRLYYLAIMCGMCAVVQGMDETVVNGAQVYYLPKFNIEDNDMLTGLVNGAPYLCCFVVGTFINDPLNRLLGRRGVIFLSCAIAAGASIWEAFTYSWPQLFLARLLLGLGIGPKSSTVPVFTAESVPANIRGALVMMWQMWTAFGIMLGYIMCVAFMPNGSSISEDTGWRLMLGSTVVVPIMVCAQVYTVPESPRWYMTKGKYDKAFESLCIVRRHEVQAARDLFYMNTLMEISDELNKDRNLVKDMLTVPRNRRAMVASEILMFMQQFCGVNVIAYYSSSIFIKSNFKQRQALLASMGFGIINWIFALPAVYTIDTFGRRNLVLFTFPFLSIFLFFTGFSFWIPTGDGFGNARLACVALGIYLFGIFYSPGMGPVPFTYSAEAYPLHIRDMGMALATGTTWLFNFILSLTWPKMLSSMKPQGAFGFYAAFNLIGMTLCFFFMPETKGLTLEELDQVFNVPTRKFIRYQIDNLPYNYRKYILREKNMPKKPDLFRLADKPIDLYTHKKIGSDVEKHQTETVENI